MVAHAFNPSLLRQVDLCEPENNLVYKASSRPSRDTEQDLVSKNKTTSKNKPGTQTNKNKSTITPLTQRNMQRGWGAGLVGKVPCKHIDLFLVLFLRLVHADLRTLPVCLPFCLLIYLHKGCVSGGAFRLNVPCLFDSELSLFTSQVESRELLGSSSATSP